MSLNLYGAGKPGKTFPDFAFPKEVSEKSLEEFGKAMRDGDASAALEAAIRLSVADGLVSTTSTRESIARLGEVTDRFGSPWKECGLLLQATAYRQIYDAERWKYDRRLLPQDSLPANPMEWDGNMFRSRILSLVEEATGNTEMNGLPLSDLKKLLTTAPLDGLSCLDFFQFTGANLLDNLGEYNGSVIPFGGAEVKESLSDRCLAKENELLDSLFRSFYSGKKYDYAIIPALARLRNMDNGYLYPESEYKAILGKYLELFETTSYCAPFLLTWADRSGCGEKEIYSRLKEYLERKPDAFQNTTLRNRLEEMKRDVVDFNLPEWIIPGKETILDVTSRNIERFYVLVYKVDWKAEEFRLSARGQYKPVACMECKVSDPSLGESKTSISFAAPSPGKYTLVAARDAGGKNLIGNDRTVRSFVKVSGIAGITRTESDGRTTLYAVEASDMKPLAGVECRLYSRGRQNSWILKSTEKSASDGSLTIEKGDWKVELSHAGSLWEDRIYIYGSRDRKGVHDEVNILTDLSIYHPGDTVGFAVVVSEIEGTRCRAASERNLQVVLMDVNGNETGEPLRGCTDVTGRFSGRLPVPSQGLLGRYYLEVKSTDKPSSFYGTYDLRVEEYRRPTFFVSCDTVQSGISAGDPLVISGEVHTYTGLPVADAEVEYSINLQPWGWWWRSFAGSASYGGKLRTDASGHFRVELDTDPLRDTRYARALYSLQVKATDPAGETREAKGLTFSIGSAWQITPSLPAGPVELTGKEKKVYSVTVRDMGGTMVRKDVKVTIENASGEIVASDTFLSPEMKLDLSGYPSGQYKFHFTLEQDSTVTADADMVIYRAADSLPPVKSTLWVPETRIISPDDSKEVNVRFGTTLTGRNVLVVVSDTRRLISTEWKKISEGFAEIKVKAPTADERYYVSLTAMNDFEADQRVITIIPEEQTRKVSIRKETFRDRTKPGTSEKWTFSVEYGDSLLSETPAFAVMTDKALDTLYPFNWQLNPWERIRWSSYAGIRIGWFGRSGFNFSSIVKWRQDKDNSPALPFFNTYGYNLVGQVGYRNMKIRGASMATASGSATPPGQELTGGEVVTEYALMADTDSYSASSMSRKMAVNAGNMKMEEAESEDDAVAEEAAASREEGTGFGVSPEIELRESEIPLAFFMPDLSTNEKGKVELSFTLPSTVGTWKLQIAALNKEMKGSVATFETVATREVMARINTPRFLRIGDVAELAATLYNNSGAEIPVGGRIEVLDASNGDILGAEDFKAVILGPSSSRTVAYSFSMQQPVSEILLRVYAIAPESSDGEQTTVAVLPASTPVIEGIPFFMKPGDTSRTIDIPRSAVKARVTLQYCDNPVWECVKALPDIVVPESENTLAVVSALYGSAVADGLFRKYPRLCDGLRELCADSALVSRLGTDRDLKSVNPDYTPWVNDAAAQTRRMASLTEYLDPVNGKNAVEKLTRKLIAMQLPSGGWSWCPDMEASPFITSRALVYLSMLRQLGYLPEELVGTGKRAVGFCDRNEIDNWERNKRKLTSLSGALNYFYVRSGFPEVKYPERLSTIRVQMLTSLAKEWRSLGIYDKGVAAIVARREGMKELAEEILRSISQFASVTPGRGMWFDNLPDNTPFNPLITSTQVLEAFAEVDPDAPEIDLLRQGILVSYRTQTNDKLRESCEVVNALLSSGSDWTTQDTPPRVMLGERELNIGRAAAVTGAFTIDIPDAASGRPIRIEKNSAGPSWGGIVMQTETPIKEVKASSNDILRIHKEIYRVETGIGGTGVVGGDLRIGDRVRVTLTIECDRPVEYLAVTDSRSAAMEPVGALSEYVRSDQVGFYREVRNASTNLFIPYLPKGTHVVSYDCFVDRAGTYSLGIATAQSQLDPAVAAHSGGKIIMVSPTERE